MDKAYLERLIIVKESTKQKAFESVEKYAKRHGLIAKDSEEPITFFSIENMKLIPDRKSGILFDIYVGE